MFRPVRDEISKITFLLPKFCAYGTCVNNPINPLILLIIVQTIIDYPVKLALDTLRHKGEFAPDLYASLI